MDCINTKDKNNNNRKRNETMENTSHSNQDNRNRGGPKQHFRGRRRLIIYVQLMARKALKIGPIGI